MNSFTSATPVKNLKGLCRFIYTTRHLHAKLKDGPNSPNNVNCDWVGPPNKESNIRFVKIFSPENETPLQKKLRLLREETQKFNHEFWAKHNGAFFQQKELYVKRTLAQKKMNMNFEDKDQDLPSKLTPEEMSVFYKKFLDDNFRKNLLYNGEWYRRNFSIYALTNKVFIEKVKLRLWKLLKRNKN